MSNFATVSTVLLWAIVLFNLLLTLSLVNRIQEVSPKREYLKTGKKAPKFNAKNLNGEKVNLDKYLGEPTTFIYVSASCAPCKDAMPAIIESYPTAKERGHSIVLVSQDPLEESLGYQKEFDLPMEMISAPRNENPLFKDYKVVGTPLYYYLDEKGIVRDHGHPGAGWENHKKKWETSV